MKFFLPRATGPSRPRATRPGGFLLVEIMVAVAIFSVSVIALGRCMSECLDTQTFCTRQTRALLALQNRMVEVQASPVMPDAFNKQPLKGMFGGMTMIERRRTLDIKNDDGTNISTGRGWNDHRPNGFFDACDFFPTQ